MTDETFQNNPFRCWVTATRFGQRLLRFGEQLIPWSRSGGIVTVVGFNPVTDTVDRTLNGIHESFHRNFGSFDVTLEVIRTDLACRYQNTFHRAHRMATDSQISLRFFSTLNEFHHRRIVNDFRLGNNTCTSIAFQCFDGDNRIVFTSNILVFFLFEIAVISRCNSGEYTNGNIAEFF